MADEAIDFDQDADKEFKAYLERCERNRRAQCENCGAFVSNAEADKQMRNYSYFYDDYGVTCESGKGCNRVER